MFKFLSKLYVPVFSLIFLLNMNSAGMAEKSILG